ncbi:Uncharacterised protein [Chlamydia trachomatis]|nr:Uncharacterised protein [Chlamydia trachomatis]
MNRPEVAPYPIRSGTNLALAASSPWKYCANVNPNDTNGSNILNNRVTITMITAVIPAQTVCLFF